jgi:hypothetical protein
MDRLTAMKNKHASNVLQPVDSDDKHIKTQHDYCHVTSAHLVSDTVQLQSGQAQLNTIHLV